MTVAIVSFGFNPEVGRDVRSDPAYPGLLDRFVTVAREAMADAGASELGFLIAGVCDAVFGGDRAAESLCMPLLLEDCARSGALKSAARGLPKPPAIGPVSGGRCREGSRQVQAADDRPKTWRGAR